MTTELLIECQQYIDNYGVISGSVFKKLRISSHKAMDINIDDAQDYLNENREKLFTEKLFLFIDHTGQKDSEIYKKAGIDRRLFSKIRSNKNYISAKKQLLHYALL